MLLLDERLAVVEFGKKLLLSGLVKGSGGNISIRNPKDKLIAITPSGVPYGDMKPEDVAIIDKDGRQVDGHLKPSSEIKIHLSLLNRNDEDQSVVHTHSDYATALACLGWEIPALHYLIGFAGDHVPVAAYAIFGSKQLSDNILDAIGTGNAVLMANHGMVAVGENIEKAFATAEMIEYVSKLFLLTKAVGQPNILGQDEMKEVLRKFKSYGKQDSEVTN